MDLKFLTYNLWYSKNWKAEIRFLQKQNADIFTLQEVTKNLPKFGLDNTDVFNELKRSFPNYQGFFAPITRKIENGKEISFGNAIFSRYPIVSSQAYYFLKPLGWTDDYENQSRNLAEAVIRISNRLLYVFTTHLTYSPGFIDTVNKVKEAKKIVDIIEDKTPFILAGDFNSHPSTKVIETISRIVPYLDKKENKSTWTKQPFSYKDFSENELRWKLDYVFASRELSCINYQLENISLSDHLPIIVDFKIN